MAPPVKARTEKSRPGFQRAAACRVSGGVSIAFVRPRGAAPWLVCLVAAALAVVAAACGRVPIDLAPAPRAPVVVSTPDPSGVDAAVPPVDAGLDLALDLPVDVPLDLPVDLPVDLPLDLAADLPRETTPDLLPPPHDAPPAERPSVEAGPVCHPTPEVCNGIDDNCDNQIDEDLPPIPCPGGGSRYCVSGRYSECPRRCEACVPGSVRECFTTLCTFWGTETCASDGRSFGACREGKPPASCAGAANGGKRTRELEDCCLAEGLCCVDEFDIDKDGDTTEMMGRCDTVVCGP
jgi:hypothetical protein